MPILLVRLYHSGFECAKDGSTEYSDVTANEGDEDEEGDIDGENDESSAGHPYGRNEAVRYSSVSSSSTSHQTISSNTTPLSGRVTPKTPSVKSEEESDHLCPCGCDDPVM